jgi:tripartite-type tricarboxylate transporter receptor subunit TctC
MKNFAVRILALVSVFIHAAPAHAQAFPSRPIQIIVPWGAGGAADTIMRALAERMTQSLGQPVIVDNRPGAGGNIGAAAAARANPDGYTLVNCSVASHGISPALYKKLPYDSKDLVPISMVASVPNVLVVNPSVPAKTLAEFVAWTKAGAGKLSYASAGIGSSPQMSMEMLKVAAAIDLTAIPYKGGAPALQDVIAGHVPTIMGSLGESLGPIKAGQVRPIAVTSSKRHPALPDVPTVDESGFAGFEVISWNALCAPARVPEPILDALNTAVVRAMSSPELQERLARIGIVTESSSRKQFEKYIESEEVKWQKLVQLAKISLD